MCIVINRISGRPRSVAVKIGMTRGPTQQRLLETFITSSEKTADRIGTICYNANGMTLSLQVPETVEQRLAVKARAAGMDVPTYAVRLLERDATRPTLLELSGEVFKNFKKSGMTDDELAEALEKEKHEAREAKRGKPFSE
jgi:hypothetical protein